jgi:RNA polymerase sigma-70 factor, ECF subfamily
MQHRPFPFTRRVASIAAVLTERAFEAIFECHHRELRRHCLRMVGAPADADDALQETFLRAWRGRRTLRDRACVRAWLYRIATNACLDLVARQAAARVAPDRGRPVEAAAPREQEPDAVVIANEVLTTIRDLPPRQHASLLLRDVLGWSAADTAAALAVTVPAANSALQRARAGVRAQLA